LVSVLDVTASAVRARGLRRVSLFGTRAVVESRLYGKLNAEEVAMPRPEEIDTIHQTYLGLVASGRGSEEARETFSAIADTLLRRDGVEAIVLAGTDLSLIFDEQTAPFPAVDCTRIHLNAILSNLLAK
jgi:aspartate racemase